MGHRIKYEIDPHNRLVISKYASSGLRKYRLCLNGYFKTDKKNSLRYHINSPYKYRAHDRLPHRVNLKGNYSLTKDHNLLFTLQRSFKQRSLETLLIKSNIVFAKENSLGLAIKTRTSKRKTTVRTLSLNGKWSMDNKNRINFNVEKALKKYDKFVFRGSWQVNKNNEIEYSYKGKQKITFKGFWEVIDNHRIRYALSKDNRSGFEIKASLERAGFLGKKNLLIYKLGTRISGKRSKIKTIKIFGRWRLTRKVGLIFEVGYSKGRKNHLSFGAEVKLSKKDELVFLLKDKKNKPLGVEITLKRQFLKPAGQALLKLLLSKDERSIQLSVGRLF